MLNAQEIEDFIREKTRVLKAKAVYIAASGDRALISTAERVLQGFVDELEKKDSSEAQI